MFRLRINSILLDDEPFHQRFIPLLSITNCATTAINAKNITRVTPSTVQKTQQLNI